MRTRIISGAVGLVLLLVVIWAGSLPFAAAFAFLAAVGYYEFRKVLMVTGRKIPLLPGVLAAILILIPGIWNWNKSVFDFVRPDKALLAGALLLYLLITVLLGKMVFQYGKFRTEDAALTLLGVLYTSGMFVFVPLTRLMDHGVYLIWLIIIGAFMTDTMAYFVGVFFGKHKLSPQVSPKKTIEGSVGGIIGVMLTMVGYGAWMNQNGIITNISLVHFAVLGLLCGLVSQIGDLAASSIKRLAGVKDYGNLMPGHGGVLDRFDSILFIGPLIYLYLNLIV